MLPAASARSPAAREQVGDQRRGGRLAVGAGDARCSGCRASAAKPDVHLGVRSARPARARPERRHVRRHARRDHHRGRAARSARGRARPAPPSAPASRSVARPALARPARARCPRRTPGRPRSRSSSVAATPLFPSPTTATSRPLARQLGRSAQRTFSVDEGHAARRTGPGCRSGSPPSSRPSPASRSGGAAAPCGRPGGRRRTPSPGCA